MKKTQTSVRYSPEARHLLGAIAKQQGITMTAVLEVLIRREARRLRVNVPKNEVIVHDSNV